MCISERFTKLWAKKKTPDGVNFRGFLYLMSKLTSIDVNFDIKLLVTQSGSQGVGSILCCTKKSRCWACNSSESCCTCEGVSNGNLVTTET